MPNPISLPNSGIKRAKVLVTLKEAERIRGLGGGFSKEHFPNAYLYHRVRVLLPLFVKLMTPRKFRSEELLNHVSKSDYIKYMKVDSEGKGRFRIIGDKSNLLVKARTELIKLLLKTPGGGEHITELTNYLINNKFVTKESMGKVIESLLDLGAIYRSKSNVYYISDYWEIGKEHLENNWPKEQLRKMRK
ncbi:MAG: hypothetical protein NTY48_05390 [Candidatus Diapherotrites archaeon]|nr:hypothetical protein [Candidatus Diapherotrites archaeon]